MAVLSKGRRAKLAREMYHGRKPSNPSKSSCWAKSKHDISADMETFNYTLKKHPREV